MIPTHNLPLASKLFRDAGLNPSSVASQTTGQVRPFSRACARRTTCPVASVALLLGFARASQGRLQAKVVRGIRDYKLVSLANNL